MLAKQLGVEPAQVQLEHVGLNHLSWERKVVVDGVDRLPDLIKTYADQLGEEVDLPGDLVRLTRSIPSYYLRYFYLTGEVLEKQAGARSRADEVMQIERELLEMYRDPALDVKPKLLEQRGGAFYSEAAAMLVESLYTDRGDVQVVNVRNAGAIPNVDARCGGGGGVPDQRLGSSSRCRSTRWRRRCSGWSSRSRPTSG